MKIIIWHNIMWSRYKAAVFSALQNVCTERHTSLHVYQIAETANQRTSLSPSDSSWHNYSYELLFKGSYEAIPKLSLYWTIARKTWGDDAQVTILAGYDRPEYWLQALILLCRKKQFACFCDSTVFDNKQHFWVGLLKRMFFKLSSGIFCYGQRAADYVKLYGAPLDKIIHRCQAAALYQGYTPQLALQRRLATYNPQAPARFLYVGRLSQEKSIDHLILAFDRVRRIHSNAKLILVGGGPEENRLKTLCKRLKLDAHVYFLGGKNGDDLFSEYLQATALVLPSHSEPWGLVVNEALSHGCPVIVSDRCGCVPELVVNGKTGYSYAWGDLDELKTRMMTMLSEDRAADYAKSCLEQIATFTPENAATSIYDGSVLLASASIK